MARGKKKEPAPEVPAKTEVKAEVLRVAPGKAIACIRGIIQAGGEVKPADINRNPVVAAKRVQALLDAGRLVKG